MTMPDRVSAPALLRRVGLLIGLLAVIAGIFGMHVMTGTHSGHSPAAVPGSAPAAQAGSAATGSHGRHPGSHPSSAGHAAGPAETAGIRDTAGTPEQGHSCFDNGTGVYAMTGSCLPSVKTGSLSAPSPDAAGFGFISPATAAGAVRGDRPHHPGTPSPGELSICRT